MQYEHTQRGALHSILWGSAGLMFAMAWLSRAVWLPALILVITGGVILAVSLCFRDLTVRDEGDHLSVRFGPLPLFGTRIPYAEITDVQPGRSNLLDGWGVHWLPGKGWIFNIWGFDCVSITLKQRMVRVGTDDLDNLLAFLHNQKTPDSAA